MIGVKSAGASSARELPALAMARPNQAERVAHALLGKQLSPLERTYALHALGIVSRDRGEISRAIRLLRQAAVLCEKYELDGRRADVLASLATVLAIAGRRTVAIRTVDSALTYATGADAARVLVRRAGIRYEFDNFDGAYEDCVHAAGILHHHQDFVWESRARANAGNALLGLGRFTEAERQFARAQVLAEQEGQHYGATIALHNRGDCAFRVGDLNRALELQRQARDRYRELGVVPAEVIRDITIVHIAAGLTEEAVSSADELVAVLDRDRASAGRRADGLIVAAKAHLHDHNPEKAIALARRAIRANHRQGNVEGERHARLVLLRAQATHGRVTKRHAKAAAELASELKDRYAADRLDAEVLAGTIARMTGLEDLAIEQFEAAAQHRAKGSALRRAAAWLAQANLADMRIDRAGLLRACDRGLAVLETHALSLGATELRATATTHGTELVKLAVGKVLEKGSGRDLLRWTERWRSTLHATPNRQARQDEELVAELAKLREIERDLGSAVDAKREAKRRRTEDRIRRLTHSRAGDGTRRRASLNIRDLVDELGNEVTLVAVLAVKGQLHTVVAQDGRVRRFEAGSLDRVRAETDYARFALRGAAVSPGPAAEALLTGMEPALARLQDGLFGKALRHVGDRPLVLMPPATLHSAPWTALPVLRDVPVAVTPSATAWIRGRRTSVPEHRRVALIAGPDLATSGAEVKTLTPSYEAPTVLEGEAATAEATLGALNGAWLAHVGAHGRFRGDNPMFSALEMADGPLTLYDLERIEQAPYRMLLTACESGVGSPTGADELLGLASSLGALGTAGLLASVVPVNDDATVPFSLVIHERLRAGDDLATALLASRSQAVEDPVARATAWSFLALGAV